MSALVGIVTYNPEARFNKCIEAATKQGVEVLVVDNGSRNIEEIERVCKTFSNVTVVTNRENKGIAAALNQIFQYAKEKQYEWVLTLDQDTIVPERIVSRYLGAITDVGDVSVLCPRIYDCYSKRMLMDEHEKKYVEVERCITSASFTSVDVWEKVGGFDEYLFIDEVDHDFCWRIRTSDFRIILVSNIVVEHQIGQTDIYELFGIKIYVRNHSAFRKYYIVRNMIYLYKKQNRKLTISAIMHAIAFMLKTVIFEAERFEKMRACVKGLYDGVITQDTVTKQ
ncbi:MAG: glycosyltransferase family 2 protein [Lachnospiraceae bacterium]|nr:glycosyltransferase family 2 protein [Lachnospiraceae bacterium]